MLQAASRMTVWLLVIALPVYACSGVLLQMLGPSHRHIAVAETVAPAAAAPHGGLHVQALDGWMTSLRSWRDDLHAKAHAHGLVQHVHQHGLYERHHHDAGDASVQVDGAAQGNDGLADASSAAAAGSASMPIALASLPALPAARAACVAWPVRAAAAWRNAELTRLERPPRG